MSGFRRNAVLVTRASRRKKLKSKKNHWVREELKLLSIAEVVKSILLSKVSIKDRLTPLSTISYLGSISSSSSFELRHLIGQTCQRRHSNDQCPLLETRGGESLLVKSSLIEFYEFYSKYL